MTLSSEVVDLSRLNLGDHIDEIGGIAEITIVCVKLVGTCRRE